MYRITLLFALCGIFSFACEIEPATPLCEEENEGTLCVRNNYDENVTVTVNGQPWAEIQSGREFCTPRSVGLVYVYVEETNYILFPDVWETTRSIMQCEETTVTIN